MLYLYRASQFRPSQFIRVTKYIATIDHVSVLKTPVGEGRIRVQPEEESAFPN